MYVSLADCHSKLVVDVCDPESTYSKSNPKHRENVIQLLQILLRCTDYPGIYPVDEIVSSITVSVWYSFVVSKNTRLLDYKNEGFKNSMPKIHLFNLQDEIQVKESEAIKHVRIMQVFDEVYKSLYKILVRKSSYPIDESDWNSEEKEQFRIYRQDLSDCFTYCFEIRGWSMINELVEWAESHVTAVENASVYKENVKLIALILLFLQLF